jgi:hypothetical protein
VKKGASEFASANQSKSYHANIDKLPQVYATPHTYKSTFTKAILAAMLDKKVYAIPHPYKRVFTKRNLNCNA